MKEEIRNLLEDLLPMVDFDSDFLFSELDSLGVTTILMTLADSYDSLVALVQKKLSEKQE